MTDELDAPNQQVVRPDGSAPWEEGSGGGKRKPAKQEAKAKDPEPDAGEAKGKRSAKS